MEEKVYNVIIIGSGPAGLTASIYAARANLFPLVIGGLSGGGQLSVTTEVDNFPGFPEGVQGPDLMLGMRKQAIRLGVEFVDNDVTSVDFSKNPFTVVSGEKSFKAKAVIISTGAYQLWLNVPGEERLKGKGVSGCALCDGFFFKGKRVVVIGGGDTAIEEATYLSKMASSVTVVHRRDALRASKAMQDRAFSDPNIKFVWNSKVMEIVGENKVTGVKVGDVVSGEEKVIETDGVFVAIGRKPASDFLKGVVELDGDGYVKKIIDPNNYYHTLTSVEGVFVAGDVGDRVYRQGVAAAGEGCKAALDAERWIASKFVEEKKP